MDQRENFRRSASCDIGLQALPADKEKKPAGLEHVPAEKIMQMQAYADQLHKKFPHMKPNRIKKKTAEHFKIKLT